MNDRVLLVDEQDQPQGRCEKLNAHLRGLLHRAFSVFVFNRAGELLLRRRAWDKYHSGGLWTNTCCSHPLEDLPVAEYAARRLQEEMGFRCALHPAGTYRYHADVGGGLIENEYDHLFTGVYDGPVPFDPEEVMEVRAMSPEDLRADAQAHPERYTAWLLGILGRGLPLPATFL